MGGHAGHGHDIVPISSAAEAMCSSIEEHVGIVGTPIDLILHYR
jgi:hypothetical protein